MKKEVYNWPYSFPASDGFPTSVNRGTVRGRWLVHEKYMSKNDMPANSTYVGLAAPGNAGSWQRESKGYQFWTKADERGEFTIRNIHAGNPHLKKMAFKRILRFFYRYVLSGITVYFHLGGCTSYLECSFEQR